MSDTLDLYGFHGYPKLSLWTEWISKVVSLDSMDCLETSLGYVKDHLSYFLDSPDFPGLSWPVLLKIFKKKGKSRVIVSLLAALWISFHSVSTLHSFYVISLQSIDWTAFKVLASSVNS